MSTVAQDIKAERISTLLWLNVINEFNEGIHKDSTFNEKYMAIETKEFKEKNFNDNVLYWVEQGLFKGDANDLDITLKGVLYLKCYKFKDIFKDMKEDLDSYIVNNREIVNWVNTHINSIAPIFDTIMLEINEFWTAFVG